MIVLNTEELEQQGIPFRAASKIVFQDHLFVKGQSFSTRLRQVAIDLCASYKTSGVSCLLLETSELLTIWREANAAERARMPLSINPAMVRPQPTKTISAGRTQLQVSVATDGTIQLISRGKPYSPTWQRPIHQPQT